ncbi:hypothetical protein CWATWH0402_1266 [Crocosphaera watsonii WH 0402]|uniref:Uncharacterized protein n=1 Tax=Crocosphaera watsonii WH 0402 TaxID=1284629 RepID=T2JZ37_CROWT|nr:hypothetical protein CWATWH0402_1266 [Crocosphaera watsonii WH 0402]
MWTQKPKQAILPLSTWVIPSQDGKLSVISDQYPFFRA